MRFVIDLDSLYVIESLTDRRPVQSVSAKRGDDTPFEVVYSRGGVVQSIADLAVLTFGAKADGKFDGDAVVLSNEFTKEGTGADIRYTGNPSFNTVPLNALFLIDGNPSNDIRYVDLMAEFTWQVGDGPPTTTKTFIFRVHNDVIRGTEGTPLEMPTPEEWLDEHRPPPLELEEAPISEVVEVPAWIALDLSTVDVTTNGLWNITLETFLGSLVFEGCAVLATDTPADLATKVRFFLFDALEEDGSGVWTVLPGGGAIVTMQRGSGDGFDNLLEFSIADDTAVSNVESVTATVTQASVEPVAGTPGTLGQLAIVTAESGGTSSFLCESEDPIIWKGILDVRAENMTEGEKEAFAENSGIQSLLDGKCNLSGGNTITGTQIMPGNVTLGAGGTTLTVNAVNITLAAAATWRSALGGVPTLTGSETLSNKTLPSPVISGTVSGSFSFSGQLEATGQAATNGTSLMTRDLVDARSGRIFVLLEPGFTATNHAAWTNSAVQITLPAGTYLYEGLTTVSTNSTTAGSETSLTTLTGTVTGEGLQYRGTSLFNLLTLAGHFVRLVTSGDCTNLPECLTDASATVRYATTPCKGILTLATQQTFGYRLKQRTATDGANPATLERSYIVFRKVN